MDGPLVEKTAPIAPGDTTPPDVASLANTLAQGAQSEGASTPEALAAALKLAAQVASISPAKK